jgi:hypothetical protein
MFGEFDEFYDDAEEQGFVEIGFKINGVQVVVKEQSEELKRISKSFNLKRLNSKLIDNSDLIAEIFSFLNLQDFFTLKLVSQQLNTYCHDNIFLQVRQFQKVWINSKYGKIDFGCSFEKIEKYKLKKKGSHVFKKDQMEDLVKLQEELLVYKKEKIHNEMIALFIFNSFKKIYEKQEDELKTLKVELNSYKY